MSIIQEEQISKDEILFDFIHEDAIKQIVQKDQKKQLPPHTRNLIYSFLSLSDLMSKISKLSQQERKAIQISEILDQPRNMKITITDNQDDTQSKHITQITRFDQKTQSFLKIPLSAYQIDFESLEYLISLLNGNLTIKIENFCQRDQFLLNTVYVLARNQLSLKYGTSKQLVYRKHPRINFQIIMRDKFETQELAKTFQKFQDEYLGFIQFDFQINKRTAGNRILKTFMMNSSKFTQMKVNSYVNFLDADSLETEKLKRIEKLCLSFFESSNKINGIIGRFTNLKTLFITLNKPPEILDLSHLTQLRKFKLKIKSNTSHIVSVSDQNDKTPNLPDFNLQNIVISDNGLDLFCIDASEHQVIFDDMLPISQKKIEQRTLLGQSRSIEESNNMFLYFGWNVKDYIVKAKVIHQELNLDDMQFEQNSQEDSTQIQSGKTKKNSCQMSNQQIQNPFLQSMQQTIQLEDGREFQKAISTYKGKHGLNNQPQVQRMRFSSFGSDGFANYTKKKKESKLKFRVEYHETVNIDHFENIQDDVVDTPSVQEDCRKMIFETDSIQIKYT